MHSLIASTQTVMRSECVTSPCFRSAGNDQTMMFAPLTTLFTDLRDPLRTHKLRNRSHPQLQP